MFRYFYEDAGQAIKAYELDSRIYRLHETDYLAFGPVVDSDMDVSGSLFDAGTIG
jgi:hypothetical protein